MALYVERPWYPSFTRLTLKTTGYDGNWIKTKSSILRLPAWPCFLDRAKEHDPYVRQYQALWSILLQWYLTGAHKQTRTYAHTHTIWFSERGFLGGCSRRWRNGSKVELSFSGESRTVNGFHPNEWRKYFYLRVYIRKCYTECCACVCVSSGRRVRSLLL